MPALARKVYVTVCNWLAWTSQERLFIVHAIIDGQHVEIFSNTQLRSRVVLGLKLAERSTI